MLRSAAALAMAAAAICLSSCATVSTEPKNSFTFDPALKQPKNPSAVKVMISTQTQRLYLVEGSDVLLATPISVGKASSPTPSGTFPIRGKVAQRRRVSSPGAGYPMTYWMEFYAPAYGMHWGFIKPSPSTAGCVRIPLKAARKVFQTVRVGTPVNVSRTQPWDETIGKSLPVLDDSSLANPPMSYMLSSQVFSDAEKGKLWQY
jgi:lipoprotein-anchoring transpeptidase ErfK/SrfK